LIGCENGEQIYATTETRDNEIISSFNPYSIAIKFTVAEVLNNHFRAKLLKFYVIGFFANAK
jgi:hypothetical protein